MSHWRPLLTFKGKLSDDPPTFPMDILLTMASRLTIPFDYNIEFQATTSDRKGKRSLYVHRSVLSGRSKFYDTSISILRRY